MGNSYFQFKQFRIDQDRCAMKVCTDSCWFGARVGQILAAQLEGLDPGARGLKVLDIGTGTGLLSLMLAQVLPQALFTAVEIDPGAAAQAKENFLRSPWSPHLQTIAQSLQQYLAASPPPGNFDVVITNPPFYENDLEGPDALKNQAHHGPSLPLSQLLNSLPPLLKPGAPAFLLLPPQRFSLLQDWCHENGFEVVRKESLLKKSKGNAFRYLLEIRKASSTAFRPDRVAGPGLNGQAENAAARSWAIRAEDNAYTPAFAQLLSPFYLHP